MTPTNTLVITGLERSDFISLNPEELGEPLLASRIKEFLFKNEVPPVHWAALKSFGRIVAVFETAILATRAKLLLSTFMVPSNHPQIKAFFTTNTPLSSLSNSNSQDHLLKLPDAGKLFFISPPPSPPAGWQSRVEAEPNTETFHQELHQALEAASNSRDIAAESDVPPSTSNFAAPPLARRVTVHESKPNLSINTSVPAHSGASTSPVPSTPTIVVEWWENEPEQGPPTIPTSPLLCDENSTDRLKYAKTERPPISV